MKTIQGPVGKIYIIVKMKEVGHNGHGRQLRITDACVLGRAS